MSPAKAFVKKLVRKCGYEIQRLPELNAMDKLVFPFVEHYALRYKDGDAPCVFDFWIANIAAHQWYKQWFYGSDNPTWELDEFSWLLEAGDRVLEIGCHHGFLTMMIAHCVGPNGFVLSIDALPENALISQAQIGLNDLGGRCVAKNLAGGEISGFLNVARRTNSHVIRNSDTGIRVPVTTGDELDERFGPFNVLKLDVEGFEANVLRGCSRLLERKPKLILELHPAFMSEYQYGSTLQDVFDLIEAPCYEGTRITRPAFSHVREFIPDQVPTTEVSNVHLRARK